MGNVNQLFFIKKNINKLKGPFLEVGSKDYGSTQNIRSLLVEHSDYLGVDLSEGEGVDLVLDLVQDFDSIDKALGEKRFNTIFCLSVIEHCEQPFIMAENLTKLLSDGGHIVISVPFAWKYHGYPSDYWRFTHNGVMKLFPHIDFDLRDGESSIGDTAERNPLDEKIGLRQFSSKAYWSTGNYLRGISAKGFKLLSKIGIFKWLAGSSYVMVPTMINMIGTKISEQQ